ncbi:MAG: TIGR03085 family protein [Mycolicibacterium frederiksbergense]|nr:TIGR03085 family protein [Mycolicibacterium frederiksbergense]
MTVARKERAALVDTMRAAGPDAPTLCEGWNTRDLAAHLVVRERRLDAAPGILVPKLAGYTARVQEQVTASTDWPELLAQVAAGPPLYSPFILLDRFANISEMFIHNEDVRRAGTSWEPRVLDEETTNALSGQVGMFARMTLSKAPARVSLTTPEGKVLATAGKGAPVTVTGDPGELLLFSAGREPARVSFGGDTEAIAAVQGSRRGL